MQLHPDWLKIAQHAWSVRLMVLAGLFSAGEVFLPLIQGIWHVEPMVFASLSGISTLGAVISRFVVQEKLSKSNGVVSDGT